MKILVVISCIIGLCSCTSDPRSSRRLYVNGQDVFTDALFRLALKALNEKPNESSVVSPFSIGMALATMNAGAGGNTSKEITDVAFPGLEPKDIENLFDYELGRLGLIIYQEHRPVDVASRVKINKFASDATKGHINELFKSSDISAQTNVAVVNAIHISSEFWKPFAKKDTKKKAFHTDDKTVKQIDMLNGVIRSAEFFETDDYVFASLDLNGLSGLEYFVLVPKKGSLAALKQQFISSTESYFNIHFKSMFCDELHITIPKFKTKTDRNLKETLKKLGIKDMFNETKADFKGISKARLLFSEFIHQAELEIDENGVMAAAASTLTVIGLSEAYPRYEPTPRYITVDKPFIFGITHLSIPIFVGQYYG
ncbi:hypothetical protein QR680_004160 [Steinernema hermaphroditum]|uniref:Serpin domain-containing protein n=1 Tax=Steinernema hermaphroditum TaxID=289476 RepID=A0AA39HNX2_9BILA|nr:hypothetical protein QR680_004160 [Steinernema hermaphroditum]